MSELSQEVRAVREALDRLESELGPDPVSAAKLEDFKATVDSIRTSVLAMVTAENPADYRSFIRKYRLRRAAQVCQNVFSGLVDGTIDVLAPGFDRLQSTVAETLSRLEELARRGEPSPGFLD